MSLATEAARLWNRLRRRLEDERRSRPYRPANVGRISKTLDRAETRYKRRRRKEELRK